MRDEDDPKHYPRPFTPEAWMLGARPYQGDRRRVDGADKANIDQVLDARGWLASQARIAETQISTGELSTEELLKIQSEYPDVRALDLYLLKQRFPALLRRLCVAADEMNPEPFLAVAKAIQRALDAKKSPKPILKKLEIVREIWGRPRVMKESEVHAKRIEVRKAALERFEAEDILGETRWTDDIWPRMYFPNVPMVRGRPKKK